MVSYTSGFNKTNPSKSEIATGVLSKSVPKHMLNIAYAYYIWPHRYEQWKYESSLSIEPKIYGTIDPEFWFYTPKYSQKREQLEVRCIDSTHLLTRTRRKSCKGGLDNISNLPCQSKIYLLVIGDGRRNC